MRLILVPPYKGMNWTPGKGQYMLVELVENMRQAGQLEGVEIDIDDGYPFPTEIDPVARNEEFWAYINLGVVKRARELSETSRYDAIIQTGTQEPGFFGARVATKIPFLSITHASIHVASLIGERFTIFLPTDPPALTVRRFVQNFGFDHKVVSVRHPSHSSTHLASFVKTYKKEDRIKIPEVKTIINDLTNQCIAAIEEDRVDSIILGCSATQVYAEEVREQLDKLGYSEIPLICALSAAVEMAKAMVNLRLTQTSRAYPNDALKTKPAFR